MPLSYHSSIPPEKSNSQKLGQILISKNYIRPDQLETALREQQRSHQRLGEILISLKFISAKDLYPLLAQHLGIDYIDLDICIIPSFLLNQGTSSYLPFAIVEEIIHIATGDPYNVFQYYEICRAFPSHRLFLADPSLIKKLALQKSNSSLVSFSTISPPDKEEKSVVSIAQLILQEGINQRASDIHFIPQDKITKVYYRIDGILQEVQLFHKPLWSSLKSHFKILSHLDLAEQRRPQDGRITFKHLSQTVDCRLSFVPTHQGESLVIRLLDQQQLALDIHALGFLNSQYNQLRYITEQTHGLFLISGPTGSGKTTTLYSLLKEILPQNKNIMTVEEPIEYRIDGIRQSEVQPGVNTFADILKSLLRHDPDVIYISEIRDNETARTAVRAALTGHLVFSTIHANSTCLIPQRLYDLGVGVHELAGTLRALMSQRLIRKQCLSCYGQKCELCHQTGYKGRQVIAEIVTCDQYFQQLCSQNSSLSSLEQWRQSLSSWKLEDLKKHYVATGITDEREIQRVFGKTLCLTENSASLPTISYSPQENIHHVH